MKQVDTERSIRQIVRSSVEAYAEGFDISRDDITEIENDIEIGNDQE